MEYFYKEMLSDSDQMTELETNIAWENQKSATSKPREFLEKLLTDVKYNMEYFYKEMFSDNWLNVWNWT